MVLMKTLLMFASGFYCVTIVILLYYLPSLRNFHKAGSSVQVIHSHILAERSANALCLNVTTELNEAHDLKSTEINKDIIIISAYYDKRLPEAHYIRLIALITSVSKPYVNIHCHVSIGKERIFTMPAIVYEMNENHGKPVGGFLFSCPIPHNLATTLPICTTKITNGSEYHNPGTTVGLQTIDLALKSIQYEFAVCVPPIFGNVSVQRFIEFVEVTRLLGGRHFYFYVVPEVEQNWQLTQVLDYYTTIGLVTLRRWNVPVPSNNVWYFGQSVIIHHCLYSTMGVARYTVFQDIDELIIPRQHLDWKTLFDAIDKGKHCGFRFYSAFFEPTNKESQSLNNLNGIPGGNIPPVVDEQFNRVQSISLTAFRRTQDVSRFRTKCIVRPELIFEMGIHHISKQNIESMTPQNIAEEMALVHHYRYCDGLFGMNCERTIVDTTMLKYKVVLLKALNKANHTLTLKYNLTNLYQKHL